MKWRRLLRRPLRRPLRRLAALVLVICHTAAATGSDAVVAEPDRAAIKQLAARWVAAATAHDGAGVALLGKSSSAYYPNLRQLALHADAATLQELEPIEQLQVMFLRLMLEPDQLQAMDARQLLAFALQRGLIGQDLRESDALRELTLAGNSAQGRLYKFGRDDWPDHGLQYFVREEGHWRIELRGELERLRTDFDAFTARSGLCAAEAAFFILETRLMRKVTPADFAAPLGGETSHDAARIATAERANLAADTAANAATIASTADAPLLRLVAVRYSLDDPNGNAVMLEDRVESLRYVLCRRDSLPSDRRFQLTLIDRDTAVLSAGAVQSTLQLDQAAAPLGERLPRANTSGRCAEKTLLQLAQEGSEREGMMTQWRNVGLRGRAQLLQQAWLSAEYLDAANAPQSMTGLRVRKLVAGSFWQQLGLQEGDLLTQINGVQVNSTAAWQQVMQIAENDLDITIAVDRAAHTYRYRTATIRPR